jgi:poly(A) RNA polymerase
MVGIGLPEIKITFQRIKFNICIIVDTSSEEKKTIETSLLKYLIYLSIFGKGKQLLNVIGDMVEIFMPSAYSVHKILRARVPIVKFQQSSMNIHCDISINHG